MSTMNHVLALVVCCAAIVHAGPSEDGRTLRLTELSDAIERSPIEDALCANEGNPQAQIRLIMRQLRGPGLLHVRYEKKVEAMVSQYLAGGLETAAQIRRRGAVFTTADLVDAAGAACHQVKAREALEYAKKMGFENPLEKENRRNDCRERGMVWLSRSELCGGVTGVRYPNRRE
jgi:hypothetical protein